MWTSAWTHIWRLWSWHCEEKILWHLTILVFVATTSATIFSLTVWILILFLLMILLVWRSRSPLLVCPYLLKSILLDRKYTAVCEYSTVFEGIHMLTLQSFTTKYPVLNLVCHVCLTSAVGQRCNVILHGLTVCNAIHDDNIGYMSMWFRKTSGERTRPGPWQRAWTWTLVAQWPWSIQDNCSTGMETKLSFEVLNHHVPVVLGYLLSSRGCQWLFTKREWASARAALHDLFSDCVEHCHFILKDDPGTYSLSLKC